MIPITVWMHLSATRIVIIGFGLLAALTVALSPLYAGPGDESLLGPAIGVALPLACSYFLLGLTASRHSRGRERVERLATAVLITALLVIAACILVGRVSQTADACKGASDCGVESVVLALGMGAALSLPVSGFALLASRSTPRRKSTR